MAKQSVAAALAAQAAAAKAAPSDAMKLEMQTTQDQVRSLEAQIDEDRKNSAQEISTLAAQLQRSREANKSLAEANRVLLESKSAEDATPSPEVAALNAKLRSLSAETDKLRAEEQRLAADNDRLAGEKQTAELTAAQLKQADAASRTLVQNAQAEADKARADLATLQAKLAESDKAVDQHNASVAELTDLNTKLTSEKTALEAQLAQAKQATDQLTSQSAASASTVTQLAAANDKLQDQLKELTAKLAAAQAESARSTQAADDAAALRTQLTAAQAKLAESDKAVEQHSASVAELTGANERLTAEKAELKKLLDDQNTLIAGLRADSDRLAQSEQARLSAEQRAAALATVTSQLAAAQRDNASLRSDNARLNETMQGIDRDRTTRIAQLQQENAAISARLRQAQGTLDQIANAARVIGGGALTPSANFAATSPVRPAAAVPVNAVPAVPEARTHVVQEGDSLTRISVRYYGTANRWQEIYEANREILQGENALRPGQRLKIP